MWALLDFYIQQNLTSNCSDIIMLIKESDSPIPTLPYIFLIRITSRVDLSMSVCPSVCPDERWDLGNYKRLGYWDLACRFLSFLRSASLFQQSTKPTLTSIDPKKVCYAHFNAYKPSRPVTPTIFMLNKKF